MRTVRALFILVLFGGCVALAEAGILFSGFVSSDAGTVFALSPEDARLIQAALGS